MQDSTFASAVDVTRVLRDTPECIQFAKMLLDAANPSCGSGDYRQTESARVRDTIPETYNGLFTLQPLWLLSKTSRQHVQ
ncbi:MAG: hypothetical protein JWP38_2235 [Herbaspirillum sp.]|nr:hypothetical protein [Herbaspirillum sp.]